MKPLFKNYFVVLAVGAFHLFFPFFGVTNGALNMSELSPTLASPQSTQSHKIGSLPLVLASWEQADKLKDKIEIDKHSGMNFNSKANYDFIVVGAGTAGSVIAARLSEHFSVLLLEAGGQPHSSHDNPAMSMIITKIAFNWMYASSVQNDSCFLCPDGKYVFSAGKGLGGSANLNYLDTLYEGTFEDYNEWMEITQDPSWGYFMLQPYFKTVKEYMKKQHTISPGESLYYRSTYKALVRPSANLVVQKYSHVNKVILGDRDDQLKALGVEYERHGHIKKAFASREVIISAGTFGSPKLLMLSGIGRSSVLNSSKINLKVDSPVGTNFHDHLAIPVGPFFKTNESEPDATKSEGKEKPQNAWNSSSILRMPLINLKYHLYAKEIAQFLGMNETALMKYMNTSQEKLQFKKSIPSTEEDSMFINVAIKKPHSRGEVILISNGTKLLPVVKPNFLNAIYHRNSLAYSSERQKLIEALEDTVRLMEAKPNWKTKFTEVPFPGCESYIFRGYGYWDCYIRHFSMTLNHGVGTCAMGASSSPMNAVVDPELNVRGVTGLRVIDASVIPTLVGTYPFLTVVVVAEKGADMIIKQHKFSRKIENVDQLELIEEDHARHDNQPFTGFRIKKLTAPVFGPEKSFPFPFSKAWQKTDQFILKSYSHEIDSSLEETDLIPPGEPESDQPNPSYFPVKPLAGRLIFYPLVPSQSQQSQENALLNGARRVDAIS